MEPGDAAHLSAFSERKEGWFGSVWADEHLKRKGLEGLARYSEAMVAAGHVSIPSVREAELAAELEAARERNATLEQQLKQVLSPAPHIPTMVRAKAIMVDVAKKHAISLAEMKGPRRHKYLVLARQEAMWRMKHECPHLSYPQIGRLVGNRDHTTVLYACRAHEKRMAQQ